MSERDAATELLILQVMLRSAERVLATLRAEPQDAELRDRAEDVLRLSFAPIWSRMPDLEIELSDQEISWREQPLLPADDDREGLLATLREGRVAGLSLVPGAEASEVVELLHAVHGARTRHQRGTDLETRLFRADFRLLSYRLDPPADDASGTIVAPRIDAPREGFREAAGVPAEVLSTVRAELQAEAPLPRERRGVVELEKYDPTLYFLEPKEIEYLRASIDREYEQDSALNVLALLLDTLQQRAESEVRDETLGVLEDLLPHLLGEGRFDAVAYLIGESRRAAQEATALSAQHKDRIDALRASVSEPRAVGQLFHALDDGGVRPTAQSMGILLRELRPQAIQQILGWSELLGNPDAKAAVTSALEQFFTEWPHALSRILECPDREVVRAALELATRLKLEGFVDPVSTVASHDDVSIRVLVARALAAIGSAPALRQLLALADDDDGAVRGEVWRTFASRPLRGALTTLDRALRDRGVDALGQREKRALFQAFGAVAGADGIETLTAFLQGRSPGGRRVGTHTRACAAVGLGVIGTPQARKALERAAQDRDPVVRTAANEALRPL